MGVTPEERADRSLQEAIDALITQHHKQGGYVHPIVGSGYAIPGMTLLDYFAGEAMITAYSSSSLVTDADNLPEVLAARCYDFAQAMVAEKRRREGATNEK